LDGEHGYKWQNCHHDDGAHGGEICGSTAPGRTLPTWTESKSLPSVVITRIDLR
jgi:hypothetical protein